MLQSNNQKPATSSKGLLRGINITIFASIASVAVAVVLVVIKGAAAYTSGSNAVLASLADSGLDLIASFVTLLSVRFAQTAPDDEHRFGHGKAEALAGVFQAGLVAVSCALIGLSSIDRLLHPRPLAIEGVAISVMVVSILLTAALVTFQSWAVKQTKSIATKGDRAHYMSDLLSNLVALIGIIMASSLGWHQADALAGLFIAIWLSVGAWHIASEAASHLLDQEAPDATRNRIRELVAASDENLEIHDLRTRISGPWLHIQFHLDLPSEMMLVDAHKILVAAENRVRTEFPDADIIIHPDPDEGAEKHGHPVFGEMA
ncbi:MAG: cation efflux family protein [Hyphomonadaceae bacterium]|nr:MAG: cation efflux family protein [Hyphomonadaceae bacterium]KAF0187070.1 MAG: cation efflux family protein [Hyphomonadaceae bacterium]